MYGTKLQSSQIITANYCKIIAQIAVPWKLYRSTSIYLAYNYPINFVIFHKMNWAIKRLPYQITLFDYVPEHYNFFILHSTVLIEHLFHCPNPDGNIHSEACNRSKLLAKLSLRPNLIK